MTTPSNRSIHALIAKRFSYLCELIRQPQAKRDLESEIDDSRSTLDRALRELHEADLVEYNNGIWKTTLLGIWCVQEREAYLDQLASITEAAAICNDLPRDQSIGRAFLIGADVHESDPMVPDAVIQTLFDSIEPARSVSLATPVLMTGVATELLTRVTNGRIDSLEFAIPPSTLEQLDDVLPSVTSQLVQHPHVDAYVSSVPFKFGLCTTDTNEAGVIVYADQGISGILLNNTSQATNWASTQYEKVMAEAEALYTVDDM